MNLQNFVFRKGQFSRYATLIAVFGLIGAFCQNAKAQGSHRLTQKVEQALSDFDSALTPSRKGPSFSSHLPNAQAPNAQAPSAQAPNAQAPNKFSMSARNELAEIRKLREQLGGVSSLFSDVENGDLERQMEDEFNSELRRLTQNERPLDQGQFQSTQFQSNQMPLSRVQSNQIRLENQLPTVLPTRPIADKEKATLRHVSQELEALAWRLEEIEAYKAADQLRDQANKLRLDCRR